MTQGVVEGEEAILIDRVRRTDAEPLGNPGALQHGERSIESNAEALHFQLCGEPSGRQSIHRFAVARTDGGIETPTELGGGRLNQRAVRG